MRLVSCYRRFLVRSIFGSPKQAQSSHEWKCKLCADAPREDRDLHHTEEQITSAYSRSDTVRTEQKTYAREARAPNPYRISHPLPPEDIGRRPSNNNTADRHDNGETTKSPYCSDLSPEAIADEKRRREILKRRPPWKDRERYWEWHDQLYLGGSWTSEAWGKRSREAKERDAWRCVRCGATECLHTDHIIPLSSGGSNELSNLQTLCEPCHEEKTGRPFEFDLDKSRRFEDVDEI